VAGADQADHVSEALHRVRPGQYLDPDFLTYSLKAAFDREELQRYFTGAGILHLTGRSLARFRLLLPPLAEQKRIVAKVDHLMSLCNTLEAKLRRAEAGAEKLVNGVIAELVA
jgi:type I restriction enzyme, S subunit